MNPTPFLNFTLSRRPKRIRFTPDVVKARAQGFGLVTPPNACRMSGRRKPLQQA